MNIAGTLQKITCLLLTLFLISCNQQQSKEKIAVEEALKSLRKIAAAREVGGVKYETYGTMLTEAKVVVNEAKDILPDGELKTEIVAAMNSYQRAYDIRGKKNSYLRMFPGRVGSASEYDIMEHDAWAEAKVHLDKASKQSK